MATQTARPAAAAEEVPDVPVHLTRADRVELLRTMLAMRGIEQRAMNLYRQGRVPGSFYDGFGQEAVSAGATFAMAAEDLILSTEESRLEFSAPRVHFLVGCRRSRGLRRHRCLTLSIREPERDLRPAPSALFRDLRPSTTTGGHIRH